MRSFTSYYNIGAAASRHLAMNSNVIAFRTLLIYMYVHLLLSRLTYKMLMVNFIAFRTLLIYMHAHLLLSCLTYKTLMVKLSSNPLLFRASGINPFYQKLVQNLPSRNIFRTFPDSNFYCEPFFARTSRNGS